MNDIQAVLGLNQMKRLNKYVKRRHEIAKYYDNELKNLPIKLPFQAPNFYSSYHLYPILISNEFRGKNQKYVYDELRKNKIEVNLHYTPVHLHPYYENLGFKKNSFPIAEEFHKKVISIPIYPTLKDEDQKYIIKIIKKKMISKKI